MSILSSQIEELRRKADELRLVHVDGTSVGTLFAAMGAMREAANTIESLSDKLQGVMGTRYCELFGTPERAARTLQPDSMSCTYCLLGDYCKDGICLIDDYDALLEWLRGDAE